MQILQDGDSWMLPLSKVDVDVTIQAGIACISLNQQFINPLDEEAPAIEVIYRFPK